jgi:hypothetical protein
MREMPESMTKTAKTVLFAAVLVALQLAFSAAPTWSQGAVTRAIGTIQTISGNNMTMKTDAGAVVDVTVQDGARVLRIEPGQTDLKSAVPAQLSDIQAGDRVLAAGNAGPDGKTIMANSLLAIKKADVESRQQKDLQDWQKRGIGGLVTAVDPAAQTVSIKVGPQTVTVHASKSTVIRRYAPDSAKFDDAKISAVDAIKPGDQVRARGARSADGTDMTADEIVSGGFRNLSGVISAVNTSGNTLSMTDLATKKPMTVTISADSQLKKLPPQMAAMLAARMKGTVSAAPAGGAPAGGAPGGGRGGRGGGGGDLSAAIARAPAVTLADLQKGDALMVVSTEGTPAGAVTAVMLVAGVEPILQAAPDAGSTMTLPAWNIGAGGPGGGDAGGGAN